MFCSLFSILSCLLFLGLSAGSFLSLRAAASEADQARRHAFWMDIRTGLSTISCERLDRADCVNYRIFQRQIEDFIADYETRAYLIPFNSDWGFYMAWGRLPAETTFEDLDDYRAYLARLQELPAVMDEYIALMRRGLEIGMTQPRVILSGRDQPIKAQLVERVEDSPFYRPFAEMPETVAGGGRAELVATAGKVISQDVIPAYRRLFEFFHREYVPGARETLGASDLPEGERFYRAQIRLYATVDMTPREIHDLGLEQVARIRPPDGAGQVPLSPLAPRVPVRSRYLLLASDRAAEVEPLPAGGWPIVIYAHGTGGSRHGFANQDFLAQRVVWCDMVFGYGDLDVVVVAFGVLGNQAEFDHWAAAGNDAFEAKVRPFTDRLAFVDDGASVASGVTAMAAAISGAGT